MTDIDTRLTYLEDIADLERMRFSLARAVDESVNDGSPLVGLGAFVVPEYSWELAGPAAPATAPSAGSLDEMLALREEFTGRLSFSLQFLAGGLIDVIEVGHRATATWVLWHPFTLDGKAWVLAGRSFDGFVCVGDDGWRLTSTRIEASLISPWDENWAQPR
jgi:hypothetical protein